MKKSILLLISVALVISVYGQKGKYNANEFQQNLEGYIVKAGFDTLRGYIYIDRPYLIEYSVSIADTPSGNGTGFQTYDIISFVYKDAFKNNVTWISTDYSNLSPPPEMSPWGKEIQSCMLNVQAYGAISLYTYYNLVNDEEETATQYLQFPDGEVVELSSLMLGFPKKMSAYVQDYKELSNKISKKEKGYKFLNVADVVREYNKWYEKQHADYKFLSSEKLN